MTTGQRRAQNRPAGAVIEHRDKPSLAADHDLHIPLSSRAVFWQPRHVGASGILPHIPFLFWLVEAQRPGRIVQIGTGDGIAWMALCQAVDKLNLEAPCLSLHIPGPGQPEMSAELRAQHDVHYGDFAAITTTAPARAVRRVQEERIDLLFLNAPLTEELVAAIRAHWMALLSERAVVVVADGERHGAGAAGQEFLDSLSRDRPALRFHQEGNSLEVCLVGPAPSERLSRLVSMPESSSGQLAARQVFQRLGQGLVNGQAVRDDRAALAQARANLEALRQQMREMEAELDEARSTRSPDNSALVASLQARLVEAELALRDPRSTPGAGKELEDLKARLDESQEKRKAFYARAQELETETQRLRAELEAAGARIAELTTDHEAQLAQAQAQLVAERDAAEERGRASEARARELDAETRRLEAELSERMADIIALSDGFEARLADQDRQRLAEARALEGTHAAAVAELTARLEDSAAQLAESNEKRRLFYARAQEQGAEIQRLNAELEAAGARIAELTTDHEAQLTQAQARLIAERDAAEERGRASEARAQALDAEIRRLSAELGTAGAEAGALRRDLQERVTDLAVLATDYQGKIRGLEARLGAQAATHEAERAAMAAQLEESNAKRREFLEDKRRLGAELDALRTQTAADQAERDAALAELTGQMAERDAALAELAERLDTDSAGWRTLAEERDRLQAELGALTLRLEESDGKRREFLEDKRRLGAELDALRTQAAAQLAERDTTLAELTAHQAERDAVLAELTQRLDADAARWRGLAEERDRLQAELGALTQRLEESDEKRREFFEDKRRLRDELAEVTAQLARRDEAVSRQAARLEAGATLADQLNAALRSRNDEIAALTRRLTELEQHRDALAQEVADLRASTSWRVTRPMRRVKEVVVGLRAPDPNA